MAGQKWELGRTENGKLGKRLFVKLLILQLFLSFFVWFLPLLVGFPVFPPLLPVLQPFIFHFCPLAGQLGRKAWYSSLAEHMAPPGRKKFWQERIEFWQDEVVGPP